MFGSRVARTVDVDNSTENSVEKYRICSVFMLSDTIFLTHPPFSDAHQLGGTPMDTDTKRGTL